jgi:hypothetical protein
MAPHAEDPKLQSIVDDDITYQNDALFGDWRDAFFRDGYAVVKHVITPERAEYYTKKQLEWLQSFDLGLKLDDESTWTVGNLPVSFKGGMYFNYGSVHEKFVWEARTEPKVLETFETLWGTNELVCSFDGMNITLPRQKDLKWKPWPHVDQNQNRKGMQCVQGLLNFQPNGAKDGGLILMKGSTKLFDEFFAEKKEQGEHDGGPPPDETMNDIFIFKDEDVQWFQDRGCTLHKMNLDAGDIVRLLSLLPRSCETQMKDYVVTIIQVLWDSRTMHYACPPQGDRIRHAQYICMTPAKFATEQDLKLKAEFFNNFEATSHWPHCNIHKVSPPMRNGELCPKYRSEPLEKPVITDRILQLAAVKSY